MKHMTYLLLFILFTSVAQTFVFDRTTFDRYITFYHLSEKYGLNLELPSLITIGMQSAGKTTLIELLMGTTLGFTDSNMATKCPVEYIFRQSLELKFIVNGVRLKDEVEVAEAVKKHMNSLKEISRERLIVQISKPDTENFMVIDLPGLNLDEPHKTEILNLFREYVTDNTLLLWVLNPMKDMYETSIEFRTFQNEILSHVNPNGIVKIINKASKFSTEWEESIPVRDKEFNLIPLYAQKDSALNGAPSKKNLWMKNKLQAEDDKFVQEFTQLGFDVAKLGIFHLKEKVKIVFDERLEDFEQKITRKISNMISEIESDLEVIDQDITERNSDDPSALAHSLTNLFVKAISVFYKVSFENSNHFPRLELDFKDFMRFSPLKVLKDGDVKWIVDNIDRYPDENEFTLFSLETPSTGKGLFVGIKDFMQYLILTANFEIVTGNEAKEIRDSGNSGSQGVDLITTLVKRNIAKLTEGAQWYKSVVFKVKKQVCDFLVDKIMKTNFEGEEVMVRVLDRIADMYLDVVSESFDKIIRRWEEGVEMYQIKIDIHVSVKSMVFSAITPLANFIVEKPGEPTGNTDAEITYNPEFPKKLSAINQLRATLADVKGDFSTNDAIRLRLVDIIDADIGDKLGYFTDSALEIYVVTVEKLLFDFDQAIEAYFFSLITDPYRLIYNVERKLRKEIPEITKLINHSVEGVLEKRSMLLAQKEELTLHINSLSNQ